MVSTVKSRRLMSMQAKKEKEEMDRQNKGRRSKNESQLVRRLKGKLDLLVPFSQSAWRRKPKRSGYGDRRPPRNEPSRTASPKPGSSCAERRSVQTETTTGQRCVGRSELHVDAGSFCSVFNRDHRVSIRYWLFSDLVPGLYVEKGWVHESIQYSFTPPADDKPAELDGGEDADAGSDAANNSQGTAPETSRTI